MHLRTALAAALLLIVPATTTATVQHYVFGLDPSSAYDIW
jgi:hypothetical protein